MAVRRVGEPAAEAQRHRATPHHAMRLGAASGPPPTARMLDRVLEQRAVRSLFQPIVELETAAVAAYEALARGPEGSPVEMPSALFSVAARSGLLTELEWECRRAAIQGALDAGLTGQTTLFINTEPRVAGGVVPREVEALLRRAGRRLRLVLELTERDLTRRPADLLRLVQAARQRWWGVALDDVGAVPDSLALLPFIQPDVVKLDMSLVQKPLTSDGEMTMDAVHAYARRTGAMVLAEGIETEGHRGVARQLGADLGQGWLFGRPAPLPSGASSEAIVRLLELDAAGEGRTPFEAVLKVPGVEVRTVPQSELALLVDDVVDGAAAQINPVVLASYGHRGTLTEDDLRRYGALASTSLFVGLAEVGLSAEALPGVRTTPLPPRSAIAGERSVVVVTAEAGIAIVARGTARAEDDRDVLVEVVVTKDLDAVLAAGQALMSHVVPA